LLPPDAPRLLERSGERTLQVGAAPRLRDGLPSSCRSGALHRLVGLLERVRQPRILRSLCGAAREQSLPTPGALHLVRQRGEGENEGVRGGAELETGFVARGWRCVFLPASPGREQARILGQLNRPVVQRIEPAPPGLGSIRRQPVEAIRNRSGGALRQRT